MRGRIVGTVAAWAAIGILTGLLVVPQSGWISVVAATIAGLIVYVPLGIVLSLAAAGWRGTLAGAGVGLLGATMVASEGSVPFSQAVAFGVTFGGLVGGTAVNFLFRLPRAILQTLRNERASVVRSA